MHKIIIFLSACLCALNAVQVEVTQMEGPTHVFEVEILTVPNVREAFAAHCPTLCEGKILEFASLDAQKLPEDCQEVPTSLTCVLVQGFIEVQGSTFTWLDPYFSRLLIMCEQFYECCDYAFPSQKYSMRGFFTQAERSWGKNPDCPKFDGLWFGVSSPDRSGNYSHAAHCTQDVFEKIVSTGMLDIFFGASDFLDLPEAPLFFAAIVYFGGSLRDTDSSNATHIYGFTATKIDSALHPNILEIKRIFCKGGALFKAKDGKMRAVKREVQDFMQDLFTQQEALDNHT